MHPIHLTRPFHTLYRAARPLARTLLALAVLAFLLALQAPPPTGSGSGEIEVIVTTLAGAPVAGLTVRYLDEWQRQPYGACTTGPQGACLLVVTDAPALHGALRGLLDTGSARKRDAILKLGERIQVMLTLDADGSLVTGGTDILATRDPALTPTLIAPEAALATLTAVAGQGIATPSPGIERTVAAAHAGMTATTVARSASATVAPTVTVTPRELDAAAANPGAATPAGALPVGEGAPSVRTDATGPILLLLIVATVFIALALFRWQRGQQQEGGVP